jgi:hypothetical protein
MLDEVIFQRYDPSKKAGNGRGVNSNRCDCNSRMIDRDILNGLDIE